MAIVTGGSQGIGAAVAVRMAAEGAKVAVVNNSHPERGDEVVARIEKHGHQAFAVQANLAHVGEVEAMVAKVREKFGAIDILVNNAAVFIPQPLEETDEDTWDLMLDVNLKAAFFAAKAVVGDMKAQRNGKIINVSSIAGFGGFPNSAAYCASKGGLNLLTKALCLELAEWGINVNGVAPGNVATPMNQALRDDPVHCANMEQRTPTGQAFLDPIDLVGCTVFLASDDAAQVHGQIIGVDGGWMAW